MSRHLSPRSRARLFWHNWRLRLSFGPRHRLRKELSAHLHQALPPLEHRLRQRHIQSLCVRALALEPNIRTLDQEEVALRPCTLAILLAHAVDSMRLENQRTKQEIESLRRQCALVLDEQSRQGLLSAHLATHAKSRLHLWADRRALSRRLDLAALAERSQKRCYHNEVLIDIAIRGISQLWQLALDAQGPKQARCQERAMQNQPLRGLVQLLFDISRPQTQLILSEEIAKLSWSGHFGRLDQATLKHFQTLATDADLNPWVRRNCVRVLFLNDSSRAIDLTNQVLAKDTKHRLSFLFRSLVVGELERFAADVPQALPLLLQHWDRADPSEHVRIRLAESLARIQDQGTRIIRALADRVCLRHSEQPQEESPKVRARAFHTLSLRIIAGLSQPNEGPGTCEKLAAQALRAALVDEKDPWVLVQLCKHLQLIARSILERPHPTPYFSILRDWSHGLVYHQNSASSPTSLKQEAAATLGLMEACQKNHLRRAFIELQRSVEATQAGRRFTVSRESCVAQLSEIELGRMLAYLSRDDWGLYATAWRGGLKIQRGEAHALRLWRLLHELRHPSPIKRKGHVHTSGRRAFGTLRAPPGRLDEATQTTVPGERVSLPDQRGWGRYLPMVDDLLAFPWKARRPDVCIHSDLGQTRISQQGSWLFRVRAWFSMCWNYEALASQRLACLRSTSELQQQAFATTLMERYQISLSFRAYPNSLPQGSQGKNTEAISLFSPQDASHPKVQPRVAAFLPAGLGETELPSWIKQNAHYFFSEQGNDQRGLSIFLTALLCLFLWQGYLRHRAVKRARARTPLCIGGWGTRGKSGTERLKSAMFHGLGYRVFSKTTGCEAMFIHSVAQGPQSEIFVFRPYGKATIWEQADLIRLSSKLDVDVFLWECMALNPTYVSILQQGWMRDDLATITNAYPDHEDIQGPSGFDVASVISQFIPPKSVALSSEINFHPLMRDTASTQKSDYHLVQEDREASIGDDFLALFPYQEHPRNIALVAALGRQLGIERDQAIFHMAEQVVPDLGVLKTYGDARLQGRTARFINGCSANERAGFLNNWHRTGCDEIDSSRDPSTMVVTLVNNRADRVSRSELFAKILVRDIEADKHLLIGSNLGALHSFIQQELQSYLQELCGLDSGLVAAIDRLRCAPADPKVWIQQLCVYTQGLNLRIEPQRQQAKIEALHSHLSAYLLTSPPQLAELRQMLEGDQTLHSMVLALIEEASPSSAAPLPECLDPCTQEELWSHWRHQIARSLCAHHLRTLIESGSSDSQTPKEESFLRSFCVHFSELFMDAVVVVRDASLSGDELLEHCARAVPPGVDLSIMGTQNIKGTGLDFVYRWVALHAVQLQLSKLRSHHGQTRLGALSALESFGDHGRLDLALLRQELPKIRPQDPSQATRLNSLALRVQELQAKARRNASQLAPRPGKNKVSRPLAILLNWTEGWIEFLDGARRFHQAKRLMRDLAAGRVSHPRATLEMREIYARNKGGWLLAWWTKNMSA